MENINWTKEELVAYILLFAANANLEIENSEKNIIISKVDMETFSNIFIEFENDNDYQSIEKIAAGLKFHKYSKSDLNKLKLEIKSLFFSDGNFDVMERIMFKFYNMILDD